MQEWIELYTLLNGSADLGLSPPKTLDRVTGLIKAWFQAVYGFQWQQTRIQPRINGETESESHINTYVKAVFSGSTIGSNRLIYIANYRRFIW